ncbi:MAG: hypothetical protein ACTHM1_07985 [Solirubrobacteraceae bacterium]
MRLFKLSLHALLACSCLAVPASAQALPGFTTGFTEPLFESTLAPVRALWLSRAAEEHAGIVRLNIAWARVALERPPSDGVASDPSWSGYAWTVVDGSVSDALARGLQVQITIGGAAPEWAEGRGRPKWAPPGTWRPDVRAYAAFVHATAIRYSGTYTPPGAIAPLPRVRYWQAWNEPNLSTYLTPQWRRAGHSWAPASPTTYRAMLDAFYAEVKSVQPDARVLAAGTAPYGDVPGGERMPPAQFVRNLLCLDESGTRARRCSDPARFDILDHHPYSVQGPFFRALNRDDVAIADLPKLIGPLRRAERLHTISGAHHHQVWVTELSWDSSPPDPHGVPAETQARWLEQSLALLWREGVSTAMWYLIVDAPPVPSYAASYQSGVYLIDGRPKPSATAFRFPFVLVGAVRRSRARFWGRAPVAGTVAIEARTHSHWKPLRSLAPGGGGVFELTLSVHRGEQLRARQAGETSLPWSV